MERLSYTIITVSTKEVKMIQNDICFDSREEAERYAEGMTVGLRIAERNYGVMMLLNGEYDAKTAISKNMCNRMMQVYFNGYEWKKRV